MTSSDYTIEFPGYFDKYAAETEAKGYFADLTIATGGRRYRPVFYDEARLTQEVKDGVESGGYYSEANVVVVPAVTRSHIEFAVAKLAAVGFLGFTADPPDAKAT